MTDTLTRKRTSGLAAGPALLLFLAVYAGALVVSLAPRGTFSTTPASLITAGD
ncbi:hypothetical protein LHP98_09505 [Rhodobacter sp. Har01]|uniref:hypothetical protein n=1 Tax=Rhodobacter sp. Har01 TaxID=2883999 RepID=UPI001D08B38F|nr:hypothetical protein [Rhodobacter sp. Har01]MCB6178364.1 hypothetical protein [Rhodobacter sp. Har01]